MIDGAKNVVFTMLVVGCAIGGYLAWRTIDRQNATIDALLAAASAASSGASQPAPGAAMGLQRECADAARKWWASTGFGPKDLAGYENHFSTSLNRCFVDYTSTTINKGGASFVDRQIVDVMENKPYGEYSTYNPGDRKYWELKPTKCEMRMGNEIMRCEDSKTFEDMARRYMQD